MHDCTSADTHTGSRIKDQGFMAVGDHPIILHGTFHVCIHPVWLTIPITRSQNTVIHIIIFFLVLNLHPDIHLVICEHFRNFLSLSQRNEILVYCVLCLSYKSDMLFDLSFSFSLFPRLYGCFEGLPMFSYPWELLNPQYSGIVWFILFWLVWGRGRSKLYISNPQ